MQHPDTPTSQFTAVRWTFYRRLRLLLCTRLHDDGTTFSLHDIAMRTDGRISADDLVALLAQRAQARPDVVTCILLARAFDVDPDFFVTDEAVERYVRAGRMALRSSVDVEGSAPADGPWLALESQGSAASR